jgi:hypothetical protein
MPGFWCVVIRWSLNEPVKENLSQRMYFKWGHNFWTNQKRKSFTKREKNVKWEIVEVVASTFIETP